DVYLFIAGSLAPTASKEEKDYTEFIRKRIKELNLHDKIIFPNRFFPNEDTPYIFGASDIVLLPYYHEDRSASGSIHLAIGAKKPVIASRIPKFEELKNICDELLVIPYSTSRIARTAIRLFEDKEFEQYVLDRTERYRRATSWSVIASQHMELYRGA
ncbi:MAG: glycosyltransferase, partial [Methanophagales archaeon]|nr:glycosyltransferase [Methanophagales archaeon]